MSRPPYLLLLCLVLVALVPSAWGQAEVRLRLAHGGRFLPAGTAVLILAQPADGEGGRIQPTFMPTLAYPRRLDGLVRLDTLDTDGRTRRTVPRTSTSRQRYFLYARTPDGRLFWSYSARRDALKYDVVESGVMSVAPVPDADARQAITRLFAEAFPPPNATPDQRPPSTEATDASSADPETPPLLPDDTSAAHDPSTPDQYPASQAPDDTSRAGITSLDTGIPMAPNEVAGPEGVYLPWWLVAAWLILPGVLTGFFAYQYVVSRRTLAALREEMLTLRTTLASTLMKARPPSLNEPSRPLPPPDPGNPIDPKRWNP